MSSPTKSAVILSCIQRQIHLNKTVDMYLNKSNFIFPCPTPTSGQERAMKKHMLKYLYPEISRAFLGRHAEIGALAYCAVLHLGQDIA
jgi:hypothetical protein